MKTYEVWSEGYFASGCEGIPARAKFHGVSEGKDFQEACSNLMKKVMTERDYDFYYNAENNRLCGCKFFDNERDARKQFG